MLQEFNSTEAAQALMDSEERDELAMNGRPLTVEYSISQQASRGQQADLADWICSMCQAVNFSRWPIVVWLAIHSALCQPFMLAY